MHRKQILILLSLLLLYFLATATIIIAILANNQFKLDIFGIAFNTTSTPTHSFPTFRTNLECVIHFLTLLGIIEAELSSVAVVGLYVAAK